MQVAKWGNSLAVRLPASVVEALDLKPGDHIDIQVIGKRSLTAAEGLNASEPLVQLRKFRGRLPADFKLDRQAIHERR
ncbi:AbrB/MazE/SpoVT family DNA-binding domain-containing protein [Pseudoduganella violacea]|uniref:Antitoxin MazE n=1 Tax=Pseudoduganella violacea TaxID=1715466 RepID=A0A7W5B8G6_9BURK|nr:AbrB/MazE/SpoVT family DNA-binding domain-containing protein [Pseudoduganella violacea]MBB3118487.1 antitoxin MazE [Pseudoduganella violacea]